MTNIALALITWRIAHMLATERGLFAMFTHFRRAIGIRYDEYSNPVAENEVAELFLCVFCLSVWVGFIVALLHYRSWDFIVWGLVYSTVSCVLERVVSR